MGMTEPVCDHRIRAGGGRQCARRREVLSLDQEISMHYRNLGRLVLWIVGLGIAASPSAQDAASLQPRTQNHTTYVSGGIGEDEVQLADAISRYFNLQLVFAERTGAFLADVDLHITDAAGQTVLDTVSEGPMFLAKVPPGRYRVAAEANGQVRTATVDASRGAKRTTLLWPATSDRQGNELPPTPGSPR
jgi:hypothetical protein